MTGDFMDFEIMAPTVLRALMISALGQVARQGLSGEHHFYITYNTGDDGVQMPQSLRAQFPEAITIVLQHEFWDLVVGDEEFSVSLAFNGVPHPLTVPYKAIIGFADPSITFGIQFHGHQAAADAAPAPEPKANLQAVPDGHEGKPGEVIALDTFRKK